MYLHHTTDVPDAPLPVRMNPGKREPFGIIDLGEADMTLASIDDARRLADAAQLVIDHFRVLGHKHPYQRTESSSHCVTCGMLKDWADHAEPEAAAVLAASIEAGTPVVITEDAAPNPPRYVHPAAGERCRAVRPGVGSICTAQRGHDGPEHVAYGVGGHELARWPAASLHIGGNLVPLGGAQ